MYCTKILHRSWHEELTLSQGWKRPFQRVACWRAKTTLLKGTVVWGQKRPYEGVERNCLLEHRGRCPKLLAWLFIKLSHVLRSGTVDLNAAPESQKALNIGKHTCVFLAKCLSFETLKSFKCLASLPRLNAVRNCFSVGLEWFDIGHKKKSEMVQVRFRGCVEQPVLGQYVVYLLRLPRSNCHFWRRHAVQDEPVHGKEPYSNS